MKIKVNTKEFAELRKDVFGRDKYTCQHCCAKGVPGIRFGQIQVHHIIFLVNGGENTMENLITLCRACHNAVHKHNKPKRKSEKTLKCLI
jgi:5-methylcytosine-specific restriction endonuclease McrA